MDVVIDDVGYCGESGGDNGRVLMLMSVGRAEGRGGRMAIAGYE